MPALLRDIRIASSGALLLRDLIAIDMRRDPASCDPESEYQG
jgi:hypothetical protein